MRAHCTMGELTAQCLFLFHTVESLHNPLGCKDPEAGQIAHKTDVLEAKSNASLIQELVGIMQNTLKDYIRDIRPDFLGPPVKVAVSFHIEGIPYISEVDLAFEMDLYFHQTWTDHRLQFDIDLPIKYVPLSHEFESKIWVPDTFFQNEKHSEVHSATVPNRYFRWFPNGTILESTHMTLAASCPMNLINFPMDQQVCSILIASYGLDDNDISFDWDSNVSSIKFGPDALGLLQNFQLSAYRQRRVVKEYTTGNFTTLVCDFLLYRSIGYYLVEMYVPTALVVVISWFVFWMRKDSAWDRMTLGVTSVLTMTTLLRSAHSNSPKVSYITAIDVYLGVCFFMVFVSLLQSTVIGFLQTKVNGFRLINQLSNAGNVEGSVLPVRPSTYGGNLKATKSNVGWCGRDGSFTLVEKITTCDNACRIIFPATFVAFNAVYWVYYLNTFKYHKEKGWISDLRPYRQGI